MLRFRMLDSPESRHKTLAKQRPECENSGAFSETTEGAFLPGAKDDRSPLKRGGFSCVQRHSHREGIGGGVLVTVGAWIAGESSLADHSLLQKKLKGSLTGGAP